MCLPGYDGNGDGLQEKKALAKLPLKLVAIWKALRDIYPEWNVSLGFLYTQPNTVDQGPHYDVAQVVVEK